MAEVERAIYSVLSADSGVSALVSDRIYPVTLPHNTTLPAVVYQRLFTSPEHASTATISLRPARIQITCFDADDDRAGYSGALAVAAAVKSALSRYSGTAGTVVVQEIFLEDERDSFEFQTNKVGRQLDFTCWYEE